MKDLISAAGAAAVGARSCERARQSARFAASSRDRERTKNKAQISNECNLSFSPLSFFIKAGNPPARGVHARYSPGKPDCPADRQAGLRKMRRGLSRAQLAAQARGGLQ